ncbi:MAG: TetR/AcrR family transcriptional regulator [Candidatus Dormibacteria bacterium]
MGAVKQAGMTRRQRAEQTRERIAGAAYRLFLERGYDDTTMQQVADAAGVAVQSVYLNFRTKARLLAAAEGHVVLGDQPRDRFFAQPWAREIAEATDAQTVLRRFIETDTPIKRRIAPFVAKVGAALPSDPESQASRDHGRDAFFGMVVDRLIALDALPRELRRARALDIMRAIDSIEAFTDLTARRGWSADEWSQWLFDVLSSQLLR